MQGYLMHHGVKGQKWGVRRYQNPDGSYKSGAEGRYSNSKGKKQNKQAAESNKIGKYTKADSDPNNWDIYDFDGNDLKSNVNSYLNNKEIKDLQKLVEIHNKSLAGKDAVEKLIENGKFDEASKMDNSNRDDTANALFELNYLYWYAQGGGGDHTTYQVGSGDDSDIFKDIFVSIDNTTGKVSLEYWDESL